MRYISGHHLCHLVSRTSSVCDMPTLLFPYLDLSCVYSAALQKCKFLGLQESVSSHPVEFYNTGIQGCRVFVFESVLEEFSLCT